MKKALLRLLLLACICLFYTACHNKHTSADTDPVFKKAELIGITEKIEKDSKNAALYFERGNMLHDMEKDTLAIKDLKKACELDSSKAEYFSAVGNILFEHKDISGSVQWIKKAIDLNPEDGRARMKIAKLFLYIKQYDNAFAQLNIVLRHNVYDPEAYFLKGMIYKDMKDTGKAISSFLTAVQVRPEYKPAIIQLGQMYAMKLDPIALKYYDNAFRLDTGDVFPLFAEGVYYQDKKDYENAKAIYKDCIIRDHQYINAYINSGWIFLQQDSVEKALHQYDLVTKIDPANAEGYYNRGLCHEMLHEKQEAINDYKQALVFSADYKDARDGLKRMGSK